ncbi:MAG: glutamine amidotransferase [Candidatus Hydrogenedentes bacterium]|nr:glutamine amidotransferase [Candidatus Hydrogenedentota bacterium]
MSSLRLENVAHLPLWLLLAAASGWVLYVTYRGIFKRSERRTAWWLMALRGFGLLALVVALAKPTWTHQTEIVDPGRLAVILDNSLSMSLAEARGESRYALAKAAVEDIREALSSQRNPGEPQIQMDVFDIKGNPIEGKPPEIPAIERTDLLHAVSQAGARLRSKPLVGIALITDGMDNTGRENFLNLAESPSPIYVVGFHEDPEAARLDLALESVQAPERVIVDNDIQAAVHVTKTAGPTIEAVVTIKRGREEITRQTVGFGEGESKEIVELVFAPLEPGHFVYTASVSTSTGERLLANNAKHFPLQVDAEPIRVFYLEGFLRHEYKFLRNRIEDDPDVALVSVVRRGNPETTAGQSGNPLVTPERLADLDVVILGDMESDYLNDSEYQALADWVEAGHALLVVGGYHSFGPEGFRKTLLAEVLPVVFHDTGQHQSEDPFVLQLTEAGRRHTIFQVSGDRVKDEAMWKTTPHLLGSSLVKGIKPGAEVLAVNPGFVGDDGPAPVVVAHRYGTGHAMVVTVDTTWRWSRLPRVLGQSDTLFMRFWSQTVRWLSGREAQTQRPLITVSTDRPDYEVGKPVTVQVARQAQPDDETAAGDISVELLSPSGKPLPLEIKASSAEPDTFVGTFYPETGGRYEVIASLTAQGQVIANRTTEFLVHGSDLELADTRTNRPLLQSLANTTGGVYVDIDEAATLAERVERRERRTSLVRRAELWNSPALFLVFVAAITTEWVIRRRNHLV